MKHTLSVPSVVIAVLLAGDATAFHLGGAKPRAMRNERRQLESVSPDLTTVSEPPTFTPSTGLPTAGGPLFPTSNSTAPGPFPTATGSPGGPTTTVDCSAMASSIFGSVFGYPTGGASGYPAWPFPTGGPSSGYPGFPFPTGGPSGGPLPTGIFGPSVTLSFPPGGPVATGPPIIEDLLTVVETSTTTYEVSSIATDVATETLEKRFPVGFGRPRKGLHHSAGIFPPGHAYPTGIFPTPTEEQIAEISHYFDVCGWGKGPGHWWPGKGKGKSNTGPEANTGDGKPSCDKGDE